MHISFIYPAALWLLLLLIPVWVLALLAPRRLGKGRFWTSMVLRSVLLLALLGSLAGTQLVRGVNQLTTVFLVDSSDSVLPVARAHAEQFIQQALATMPKDDRAAIVVFGENALVERAPSSERSLRRLLSVPIVSRTNIGAALELGLALLPGDSEKRLVLLSDGGENAGDTRTALQFAQAQHVPIDVVALNSGTGNDAAQLDDVRAPAEVRKGQTVNITVAVRAPAPVAGTLRLRAGDQLVTERAVQLKAGAQEFNFQVPAETTGFVRYSAEIEVQGDQRRQNNEAATLVNVTGEPHVLVVEGNPGEAQNLVATLQSAHMNPATITPAALPPSLASLASYDATVLVNVAAGALPPTAMQTLPAFVRDLGHGLVMVGGDRSFGMGNYAATPLEAALPVDMQVKDRNRRPDVALVFVLDKSGSMAACHCNGANMNDARIQSGVQKVDIAKDAIVQASALLQPQDKLGVVAFDNAPHWALNTAQKPTSDQVLDAIKGITPNGSTNIRAGLLAAKAALDLTDAKVKHVELLTDGWSSGSDNLDIAREMRAAGITLSTVAAGSGSAPYLEQLAQTGGGRYYPVENMEEVPQILVAETLKIAGNFIVEKNFVPTLTGDSPILHGLTNGTWPQLRGYNGTEAKATSQVILQSPDGDPVLAQWQYGLGRAVAWTSDLKGQWGRDLVSWNTFGQFAAQLVGWSMPRHAAGLLNGQAANDGLAAVVTAGVHDANNQPLVDAQVAGTVIAPDGKTIPITLKEVAPGQFQTTLPSPQTGSYLVQLTAQQGGQPIAAQTIGLVVPYSPEYRQRDANPALLQAMAQQTRGQLVSEPGQVFRHDLAAVQRASEIALPLLLLALLLLPFDIAVRRLGIRRSDFAAIPSFFRRTARSQGQPPMFDQLRRAQARAVVRPASTSPSAEREAPPTWSPPRMPRPLAERPTTAEIDQLRDASSVPPVSDEALARLRAAKERAKRIE
ncbi:MAG: VWA domain-containing protein [Herpetosiphonaceae bacterium]|nr:VWA domain-containing protein [Herpetosiphonaceae bacterium]